MNKETIKQIILAAQEMIPNIHLVERSFVFEPNACQVLVGIRRAGKSFLLYQYIQQLLHQGHSMEEMLFVNFEDERILGMTVSDLHLLLEAYREMFAHRPFIFLDEIQNIEEMVLAHGAIPVILDSEEHAHVVRVPITSLVPVCHVVPLAEVQAPLVVVPSVALAVEEVRSAEAEAVVPLEEEDKLYGDKRNNYCLNSA